MHWYAMVFIMSATSYLLTFATDQIFFHTHYNYGIISNTTYVWDLMWLCNV